MSYYTQKTFPHREHDSIVKQGERYKEANSQMQAQQVQKDSGVRWSQLLLLLYFDCIRQQCLDPMHLIFSGMYTLYTSYNAKINHFKPYSNLIPLTGLVRHEVELILNNINPANILEVQRGINSSRMPHDVGRLPGNAIIKRTIGM